VTAPGDHVRARAASARNRWLGAACTVLGLLACGGRDAFAQGSAECATPSCQVGEPSPVVSATLPPALLRDLARAEDLRLQFVAALRDFTVVQAGTMGDVDSALARPLADLDRTRREWDTAIEALRTRAARTAPSTDLELAMASLFLGRLAIDDALLRLDAAARLDDSRSDVHVAQALALTRRGRNDQALNALRRARALTPDDPAILYQLAQKLWAQNRDEEAVEALRAFARVASRGAAGARRFARLELVRETAGVAPIFPMARYAPGLGMLVDGRLGEAVHGLRRAGAPEQAGDPGLAAALVAASSDILAGQVAPAIARLDQDAARWPRSGDLHRVLGIAYRITGQQSEAIAHLRQARALDPADERARLALADLFAADGREAEADRELRDALAAMPESGQARYRLAELLLDAGNLPGAIVLLRDIVRLSPPIAGREHVWSLLGSTLVKMADFDGAVDAYRDRIAINPNSAAAHRQLAEVYFLLGRHDEALGEFTAAVWLDSGDAQAHAGIAQVLLRTDRPADAARAAALAIDAGAAEARFTLGTALIRQGRNDEGRAQLAMFQQQQEAAQEQGRREFQLDAVRREAARQVDAPAAAISLLEEALALDPDSARSHRELGLALLRGGAANRGRDHLERAQQIEPTAEIARRLSELYRRSNVPDASARHAAEYDRLQRVELERRLKQIVPALSGIPAGAPAATPALQRE
jgi:tetratricopeptide (TPR) repeat protein